MELGCTTIMGSLRIAKKQLTLGACTLLLHGMRHWPQMVDTLFWPFAIKAVAERMNTLHVNSAGQMPESLMYGVDLETVPVRNFHTLFYPVYVLDHQLQSAGGPGPPKWEPRSHIGVYLGHSPFHADSVTLVFKPKTVRVSLQYHIVFDNDFGTVLFMERGEVPPNWDNLCKLCTESAVEESADLALEWMSGQQMDVNENGHLVPIQDRITNPFNIVPDQHDPQVKRHSVDFSNNISTTLGTASEEERNHSSLVEDFGKAAAAKPSPLALREDRVGIKVNLLGDFEAAASESGSLNSSEELKMPQRVNLHQIGLHCSKQLAEQKSKVAHKAHITYSARARHILSMFALICAVNTYTMPRHRVS